MTLQHLLLQLIRRLAGAKGAYLVILREAQPVPVIRCPRCDSTTHIRRLNGSAVVYCHKCRRETAEVAVVLTRE